jgi:hypothetical protein
LTFAKINVQPVKSRILVPIDADGTACDYLLFLAFAPTGVFYSHQCGGFSCTQNEAQGFIVQVGDNQIREELYSWFQTEFRGSCMSASAWTTERIETLSSIVSRIACWRTDSDGSDHRAFLSLDISRISTGIEAWIPATSPYGSGVIILNNSD